MKKKRVLVLLAMVTAFGTSACGTKKLELTTNQIVAELGSELDTTVTNYVADADVAAEAAIDFSAVDMSKVGTYSAVVTYKEQTAGFDVVVVDTTAPEVTVAEQIVVAVGEPLYAKDVITSVTELGGEVEVAFSEPEGVEAALDVESDAGTEAEEQEATEAEETETAEDTETASEPTKETGDSEAVAVTEKAEELESNGESTETAEPEAEFVIGDVLLNNAYVIYSETGEYDNILTVTDASGNSTEVTVHIVVGDAPTISGVEDLTVTVGIDADEIDYLDGVTAVDSNGNDITSGIVCDSAAVNLEAAGEYEITYTVTDEDGFTATEKATVTVEEKSGKKTDGTKNSSGKTDSKSDASKANSSASGGNAASASGGSNTSGASDNSGNNSSNTNDSGNSGNTSGGGSTSDNSGNSGSASTPGASNTDNGGSTSTPSTDNSGSTSTPAPETPSTDTGSDSSGEMAVPDYAQDWEIYDSSTNPPRDDELGGSGAYWE